MMSMTFHESYGELPTMVLRAYRKFNASPADHDTLMRVCRTADGGTDWQLLYDLLTTHSSQGYLALPIYL